MKKLATLAIVAALSVAALTGCGGGTGTSKGGTPVKADIKMEDTFKFTPNAINANKGDALTVHLTNTGTMPHDFTISALKINKTVDAGQSLDITVPTDKAGSYDFVCTQPGHKDGGMTGKLTIK